ncbi:MAG: methylated-DNA--[protein]-cysteine S-methyltransferase [Clostridiales bacterium]|nr:methylated-DNA--[protein]-cysteine S-methyltransferase [Clostridiales bacterium]
MEKTQGRTFSRRVDTPAGPMTLVSDGEALIRADFGGAPASDACPILDAAERELREFFAGKRRAFTVPLKPSGTPFQLRVWAALREIPYGETRSYQDVARAVGNERATRAVGGANNRNPISVIVPCHRVIGKGGSLVGYGGGLERKRYLLELEGRE